MRWYWILLVISFPGLMGATVNDLVVGTSMVTLGLMIPVWVVLANLWWVMILVSPSVLGRSLGRPWLGVGVSLALALGGGAWFWSSLAAARERVLPAEIVGGRVEGERPFGVELVGAGMDSCDILCRGLLSGPEVAWLRGADEGVVWVRAPDVECEALDPGRTSAPCILAERDLGQAADLRIALVEQVPGRGLPDPKRDWVGLKRLDRVEVTDRKGGAWVAQSWAAEEVWLPLLTPAFSMELHATRERLAFLRHGIASEDPGLRGLLDRLGLKASDSQQIEAVTVMSMLWATSGRWRTEGQEELVTQWLLGLEQGERVPTKADRQALGLVRGLGLKAGLVEGILARHPDWTP